MKLSAIVLIFLLMNSQAGRAEEGDFNFESESSSEEAAPKPADAHPKSGGCDDVSVDGLKIRSSDEAGNLRLEVVEQGKVTGSYEPYIDGPGNKCLKLKKFETEGLFLLEVCHGLTGTSVLVERHSLLVLRLENKKFRQAAELEIKYVEREGKDVRVVNDKSYKTKKKDGKALLILKDKQTKKETEHLF